MTTFDSSPRFAEPEPVWRDVDGSLFTASAALEHEQGAARVHVVGDLCPSSAPVLRHMLDGLVSDGIETIVVDMTELRFCTSHGLDVLGAAGREMAARGGTLSVEHADGVVRRVLDIAGRDIDITP